MSLSTKITTSIPERNGHYIIISSNLPSLHASFITQAPVAQKSVKINHYPTILF